MDRPTSLNLKYVAILTVVASLILVVGALLRPGARSSEQAPPSDTDLARLARLTERRTLESAAAFLSQVADDVSPALVWLERPGTTGVAWNEGTIVTARIGLPAETVAQVVVASAEGVESTAGIDWSPDLPAAGVRVVTGAIQPPRPVVPTRSGDPLLIVWKTSAGRMFAAAGFADVVETTCGDLPSREVHTTMEATRAMAGGGLFDLDGNLLGVILPCGDRYAAVVPDAVDGMLATVESFASRLLARYGMAVEPLTEEEAEYFDVASGAIVRELRAGSPAAAAGLQPGDVIVALDGAPVAGTDDLRALAAPTALPSAVFSVHRDAAVVEITVPDDQAAPRAVEAGSSGIVWESPPREFRVGAVVPGSRAAAAGIQSGDRVVRLGQRAPESLEQVRRALDARTGAAIFVEIERAGRRRAALVTREAR